MREVDTVSPNKGLVKLHADVQKAVDDAIDYGVENKDILTALHERGAMRIYDYTEEVRLRKISAG